MICDPTAQVNLTLAETAYMYGSWGWRVLPIHTPTGGGCDCGKGADCPSAGKHPRTANGIKDASTDEATIAQWWARWPAANVGIATGRESGILVIDIDGECELPEVLRNLPPTVTARTARGRHIYLRYPLGKEKLGNRTKVRGLPVDVRGEGGYVLAPPSLHASGERYAWIDHPHYCQLAEPTPALLDWLYGQSPPPPPPPPPKANGQPGRYGAAALAAECAKVASTAQGGRNDQLFRSAAALYELVAGGELVEADVAATLMGAAAQCGLSEHEARATIASGRNAGTRQPRHAPERNGQRQQQTGGDHYEGGEHDSGIRAITNYKVVTVGDGKESRQISIGLSQDAILGQLRGAVGKWPKCLGGNLFVEGAEFQPEFLKNSNALFAWIGSRLGGDGEHAIQWKDRGENTVSRTQFFEYLLQSAERFEAVHSYPHFPPMPACYYMHPPVQNGDGKALEYLVSFFQPATAIDRELLLAFTVQMFWGGELGKRPAWLITGPDKDDQGGRGIGKTTAAEKLASLVGGTIDVKDPNNAKTDELDRRLLSPEGRLKRVFLIDNLKALRFSWSYIESTITATRISGRQMFVGEGSRPNDLNVVITANGAGLSRDMAQRCLVLKLARPAYASGSWDDRIDNFLRDSRQQILGDVKAFFERPRQPITIRGRWGAWERDILCRLADPDAIAAELAQRAADCDEDAEELELVRSEIRSEIASRSQNPNIIRAKISAKALAALVNRATGERRPITRATAYARSLGIPELGGQNRRGGRFYYWVGCEADADAPVSVTITDVSAEESWRGFDDADDADDA